MGDLNTMGMDYLFDKDIEAEIELKKLAKNAKTREMRILEKDFDKTWTNGRSMFGNLDHVVASKQLKFKKFVNNTEVEVSGWKELIDLQNTENSGNEFKQFVKKVSDHNSLYFEIKA